MKLEVFEKIVTLIKQQSEKTTALYRLGIDITDYEDSYSEIITHILRAYYGSEGEDWISWYIHERDGINGEINEAWDKDNNPICYDIPSLWKHVEELRCSTDFKEYELKKRDGNLDFMVYLFSGFK